MSVDLAADQVDHVSDVLLVPGGPEWLTLIKDEVRSPVRSPARFLIGRGGEKASLGRVRQALVGPCPIH
jgi:hypothetical protein